MEWLTWITENWELVVGVLIAAHALAKAITMLTPTPTDDEWVAKIYKWIDVLALNWGKTKQ